MAKAKSIIPPPVPPGMDYMMATVARQVAAQLVSKLPIGRSLQAEYVLAYTAYLLELIHGGK